MSPAVPPSTPAVLLHGFAGTGAMWDAVRDYLPPEATVITPDLRGHGGAGAVRPVGFAGCVADVLARVDGPFTLAGYSQGGRVALHVALASPERVTRLVLVATTAGIEDARERAARAAADRALALRIQRHGLEAFAAGWVTQPLFAHDPPEARAAQRADIARNTADGLAAALRGIGTGEMPPLWDRLHELTMPVRVLAGERDAKYRALAERLAEALPDATLVIVPGAGHGVPREAPAAVAAALL